MGIAKCLNKVDAMGKELIDHGSALFPIASYDDDFAKIEVPWHWHEEMEIGIVIEGEIEVAVDSQKYILKKEDAFFINSGALHGAWDRGKNPGRIHSVVFHPRIVGGSLDSIYWQNYTQPVMKAENLKYVVFQGESPWHLEAASAIAGVWKACVQELPGYEFDVRNALSKLIFLLSRYKSSAPDKPSAKMVRDSSRIKVMLQYIQEHYMEEIAAAQIAESADISESECLRCFRNTIGATPIQFLKQLRIQKAAELLGTTKQKVVDIGIQCGFQDMSYFAKTFREMRGCTPSEYRRSGGKG